MKTELNVKVLLLGDSSVGKSSLLLRYTQNEFKVELLSTLGLDFRYKQVTIENQEIKLQIWDTAGQEKYRIINNSYFKGAKGVLIVYDITNRTSFEKINKNISSDEYVKILIGNKSDMYSQRQVLIAEGEALASELGMSFFETSAKTGQNVDETFKCLAEFMKMLMNNEKFEIRDSMSLQEGISEERRNSHKNKCCLLF